MKRLHSNSNYSYRDNNTVRCASIYAAPMTHFLGTIIAIDMYMNNTTNKTYKIDRTQIIANDNVKNVVRMSGSKLAVRNSSFKIECNDLVKACLKSVK